MPRNDIRDANGTLIECHCTPDDISPANLLGWRAVVEGVVMNIPAADSTPSIWRLRVAVHLLEHITLCDIQPMVAPELKRLQAILREIDEGRL